MNWKDVSSHSQNDTKRETNCMRAQAGSVYLTVHRHIHYEKDDWLASCSPLFDKRLLKAKELPLAMGEAEQLLLSEARKIVDAVQP